MTVATLLARVIVATASRLVPPGSRPAWREEWLAELDHGQATIRAHGRRAHLDLVRFAIGAAADAFAIRRNRAVRHARARRRSTLLSDAWADVRYGIRTLRRDRAVTFSAVFTLALGIGINAAMFNVVQAVLLAPPPFPEPDRLVHLFETSDRMQRGVTSPPNFRAWAEREDLFDAVAAIRGAQFHLEGQGTPERQWGRRVSPSFFAALRVPPLLGRVLVEADDAPGANVAVIGHGIWTRHFGADSAAVGRTLVLNGASHTVIGVMPRGFDFPSGTELWAPMDLHPELWEMRGAYFLSVIARLRDGLTLAQAQTGMDAMAAAHAARFPDSNAGRGIGIERMHDVEVSRVRRHLWMLFGAVGMVLLIACTNVAGLLLGRSVTRAREMSIRTALGASHQRLVRQILVESGMLGIAGAVAGLVLAGAAIDLFVALAPAWFPRIDQLGIGAPVLAYSLGLGLLTSVAFGLAPVWRVGRGDLGRFTHPSRPSPVGGRHRGGTALVIGQTALAFVLLLGAGLLIRSFHRLTQEPLGFSPRGLLVAEIPLPTHQYSESADQFRFFQTLLERAGGLPGVRSVAAANTLPFGNAWYGGNFQVEALGEPARAATAMTHHVTPGYFATLGIEPRIGRTFTTADRVGSPLVAVVNQTFVRQYLADVDPLRGRLTNTGTGPGAGTYAIVGVVGDAKQNRLDDPVQPALYFPTSQQPQSTMLVFARVAGDPMSLAAPLRTLVGDVDARVPVVRLQTMEGMISSSVAQPRLYTVLLTIFAGTAMVLAVVGVYGLLSFLVAQQTREFGIRMALGADRVAIVGLVVRRALRLLVPGLAIGLTSAVWLTRFLEGLLYGITPTDPLTFSAIAAAFMGAGLLAAYVPARSGTAIAPLDALRSE